MATEMSDQTNQSQSSWLQRGKQMCTVGQQEGRPPRCILTREINCGEKEEKTDGRRGDGDEERRDGHVTPSQEGREERVKRKHWKRTGSMVRDSRDNTMKKREEDGRGKVKEETRKT